MNRDKKFPTKLLPGRKRRHVNIKIFLKNENHILNLHFYLQKPLIKLNHVVGTRRYSQRDIIVFR